MGLSFALKELRLKGLCSGQNWNLLVSSDNPNSKMGHLSRNGLQIVAALVRMEARNHKASADPAHCPLEELASRLDTIVLTHKQIDPAGDDYSVPLDACIHALIRDRSESLQKLDQIISGLTPVQLPLDKAVPVMLLFAEVLSVITDHPQGPVLQRISLAQADGGDLHIGLELDGKVEDFEQRLGHQMIALMEKQLRARIVHQGRTIEIVLSV